MIDCHTVQNRRSVLLLPFRVIAQACQAPISADTAPTHPKRQEDATDCRRNGNKRGVVQPLLRHQCLNRRWEHWALLVGSSQKEPLEMGLPSVRVPRPRDRDPRMVRAVLSRQSLSRRSVEYVQCVLRHPLEQWEDVRLPGSTKGGQERQVGYPDMTMGTTLP